MAPLSGRSVAFGLSRRIPSSRFRSTKAASKRTPKTAADTPIKDYPPDAGQAEIASRQDLELRLEGRRLSRLGGGDLLITCACGHSGEVPVAALVARHGEEARVQDAIASMRCITCGAQRIQRVRWLG